MTFLKLILAIFGVALYRHARQRKQYMPRGRERHDWD